MIRVTIAIIVLVLISLGVFVFSSPPSSDIILVTTTSTHDSGLLDALIPRFENETGYTVKTIAIGTGQALATGARGEADVVLVHAPELELEYVKQGVFTNRRRIMHNDFLVLGPPTDPAGIKDGQQAAEAFGRIAKSKAPFVSRGDNSGTHFLEQKLWKAIGVASEGDWYIEAGQGMGATLMIASEKGAYTLSDRGTYLAFRSKLELVPVVQGDPVLLNLYHVMEVDPQRFPKVSHAGARAFSDFLISPEAQSVIKSFGVDRFGSPLFLPDDAGP
jgi:tungstate transport system substrate-binding protein